MSHGVNVGVQVAASNFLCGCSLCGAGFCGGVSLTMREVFTELHGKYP